MGIGASVFLIALGLILALAVKVNLAGLDVQVVGWILVLAGLLGLALFFTVWNPRRRVTVVERNHHPVGTEIGHEHVVEERRYDDSV